MQCIPQGCQNASIHCGHHSIASGIPLGCTAPFRPSGGLRVASTPGYFLPSLWDELQVSIQASASSVPPAFPMSRNTLLMSAIVKSLDLAEALGVYAIEVQAIDSATARFYGKDGFSPLLIQPLHLYLALATAVLLPHQP